MSHFSKVGMKSRKTRFWVAVVHVLLVLGSISMILPFMVMISTSFTSNVDSQDFSVLPKYWYNDRALYQKYVESAFDEDITLYNRYTRADIADFRKVEIPRAMSPAEAEDFDAFKKTLPTNMMICAHAWSLARSKTGLEGALRWQEFLRQRYNNDIAAVNIAYGETHEHFDHQVPVENWGDRRYQPADAPKFRDEDAFKKSLPSRFLTPLAVDGMFEDYLKKRYELSDKTVGARYGAAFTRLSDLHLTRTLPRDPRLAKDWAEYVCSEDGLGLPYIVADPAAAANWRAYLRRKYRGDILAYNRHAFPERTDRYVASFDAIPFYERVPREETLASDWSFWLKEARPAAYLTVDTPEFRYRDFLKAKYRTVAAMEAAYGPQAAPPVSVAAETEGSSSGKGAGSPVAALAPRPTSFETVAMPLEAATWHYLSAEKSAIRREFAVRNYRDVVRYIALRGKALRNTVLLVVGTIVITLTINPMAAYALSRFNLPWTQQILLFLLATMAFPAEVSAIPGFLLLKKLHLLNTFWALWLPGMANGFSIFLLKGFFDSLPQELFEAADLDGATKLTVFVRLVMPMSTPILAVISLGAFAGAYGSFMWAFVVCQNEKMWTLMVWLQQMSMWASQSMIFAALVVAAIPTLLVFIFMQRVIMQGVIIPMEK